MRGWDTMGLGVTAIVGGATGRYVLAWTGSSNALIALGVVLLAVGAYRFWFGQDPETDVPDVD